MRFIALALFTAFALAQPLYTVQEIHLFTPSGAVYLAGYDGDIQSVMVEGKGALQAETLGGFAATGAKPPASSLRQWLYDGRWFSWQGLYWELQPGLNLEYAQTWINQALEKRLLALGVPLLLGEDWDAKALQPLSYSPAPAEVRYTTLQAQPAPPQATQELRLLAFQRCILGGLRSRMGWLGSAADLQKLWSDLGLETPPAANFGRKVFYYFSGIKAQSGFNMTLQKVQREGGRLSLTLEASTLEVVLPQPKGVLFLLEASGLEQVQLLDARGQALGSF